MSPFAQALAGILDDTGYLTREQWACFLAIPEEAIEGWLRDESVPRADVLRLILDALKLSSVQIPRVFAAFDDMAARPSEEVSPFHVRMSPTVREYTSRVVFTRLGDDLRDLPLAAQQRVLVYGSWES